MIALELGYPHPNLLLEQLTSYELRELIAYYSTQEEHERRSKVRANEESLRAMFDRLEKAKK